MKTKLFLFFTILFFSVNAQSGFGEAQLIDVLGFQVSKVFTADLDGDGLVDVLASGQNANTIAWYKNIDGQGSFSTVQYIAQNLNFTQSLSTADLDGDGDLDVLATSAGDNKVVWYKNLDGLGDFSLAIIIDNNALNAKESLAADIDGDNDMDVVVAIKDESKVVWYENLDGLGNFSTEKIITNNAPGVYQITTADVDGDGFLDVLANSSSMGLPSWFKNVDGQGSFGTENIIDSLGTFEVIATDVDGDGDQDLIKSESVGGVHSVHWLENTDGLGAFIQRQNISNFNSISDINVVDVDNDGDIDLLATYVGDGKVAWFENLDGLGTFGERKIIENDATTTIIASDIDGDGYKDVVTRINGATNLVWYKNLTYLSINDNTLNTIVLSPNPTNGMVTINAPNSIIVAIEVYDMLGKQISSSHSLSNTINLENLQTGMYLVKIKTEQGFLVKKIIKE